MADQLNYASARYAEYGNLNPQRMADRNHEQPFVPGQDSSIQCRRMRNFEEKGYGLSQSMEIGQDEGSNTSKNTKNKFK